MPKRPEKPTVTVTIPLSQLVPNTYNPKDKVEESSENERQYRRILKSMARYGQLEAILVRQLDDGRYEIINGFHRHKAATELGWDDLLAEDFGKITDNQAKALAVVTEDARVALNRILVSKLVTDLLDGTGLFAEDLPYDEEDIRAMKEMSDFKWQELVEDDGAEKEEKEKPYSIVLPDSHVTDWNQLKTAKGFQYDTELLVWLIENANL